MRQLPLSILLFFAGSLIFAKPVISQPDSLKFSVSNTMELMELLENKPLDWQAILRALEKGADFTMQISESEGQLIHKAAAEQQLNALDFILKHGFNANTPGPDNKTPVHFLVESAYLIHDLQNKIKPGTATLLELLMKKGANINLQTSDGNTPLHLAIETGNADLVKLILSYKPALFLNNKEGLTPLAFAAKRYNHGYSDYFDQDIIRLLEENGALIHPLEPLREALCPNFGSHCNCSVTHYTDSTLSITTYVEDIDQGFLLIPVSHTFENIDWTTYQSFTESSVSADPGKAGFDIRFSGSCISGGEKISPCIIPLSIDPDKVDGMRYGMEQMRDNLKLQKENK